MWLRRTAEGLSAAAGALGFCKGVFGEYLGNGKGEVIACPVQSREDLACKGGHFLGGRMLLGRSALCSAASI